MADSYVQVAPDSTGKYIRNVSLYVLQADGTPVLTQMQVVVPADANGKIIDLDLAPLLEELLLSSRETNRLIGSWPGLDPAVAERGPIEAFYARRGLANNVVNPHTPVMGMSDVFGRQVVLPHATRDIVGAQGTTISNSTAETTIVTAAPDVYCDLAMLIISNTSAATSSRIDIRDTTAGTILFSLQSVGGAGPVGFAMPVPIPQTNKNTNWTAQCGTAVTDLRVYAVFVKNR